MNSGVYPDNKDLDGHLTCFAQSSRLFMVSMITSCQFWELFGPVSSSG